MMYSHRRHSGFSLIELLIVIAILSIVAASVVTNSNTQISEQLEAAARVLAGDLDYTRNLALTYHGKYKLTFDAANSKWTLAYSGTDTTLATLPRSPFRSPLDSATQQTTSLTSLPGISMPITIYSVYTQQSPLKGVTSIEFDPLGATVEPAQSVVWLATGAGKATRYVEVDVNPVTGLATVGKFQSTAPARPASTPSG
ncbi:MAG: type II secretion system GspH family protein [Planctomycetia bacterium]|nr:type II secretion system GspH family protein [Planctomycetia bacterium]